MSCSGRPKCKQNEKDFFACVISELETLKGSGSGGLGLNEQFINLDEMAGEITGRYMILKIAQSTYDPLYDEPINNEYHEEVQYGFELKFFYAYLDSETNVDEKGRQKNRLTRIKILKDTWAEKMTELGLTDTYPKHGDVVKINDYFYDVTNIGRDQDKGIPAEVEAYNMDLARREKFLPERKLNT
jgi:hypothetical protein